MSLSNKEIVNAEEQTISGEIVQKKYEGALNRCAFIILILIGCLICTRTLSDVIHTRIIISKVDINRYGKWF